MPRRTAPARSPLIAGMQTNAARFTPAFPALPIDRSWSTLASQTLCALATVASTALLWAVLARILLHAVPTFERPVAAHFVPAPRPLATAPSTLRSRALAVVEPAPTAPVSPRHHHHRHPAAQRATHRHHHG